MISAKHGLFNPFPSICLNSPSTRRSLQPDVFRWLTGNSSNKLDIMAQYWKLIAQPDDPRSGDYGFSEESMKNFGSGDGTSVYKSIEDTADRDANVRLLQHSGVYPDYTEEPSALATGRPNVKNVCSMTKSGYQILKMFILDLLTMTGNLTQVKELGIYLVNCTKIAKTVEIFYNNLWKLGSLNHSDYTRKIWDQQWQISRTVPCWSHFIPLKQRCSSSHIRVSTTNRPFNFQNINSGSNYSNSNSQSRYLSFAPPELSFKKLQADEQAWIETVKSIKDGETV